MAQTPLKHCGPCHSGRSHDEIPSLTEEVEFPSQSDKHSLFSLSGRTVFALSQDIDSLCLVKECRELEEGFGTHVNDNIVARREVHLKDI